MAGTASGFSPFPKSPQPTPKPSKKMSETHETILRCLGYGIEFIQLLAVPAVLAAMTRRLAK
jgi:hypothetical protein